jgi:hypothetical protein
VLAVAGAAVVLVWGAFVQRNWHGELAGLRVGAAVLLVLLTVAGLWSQQWVLVLAAGVAGLFGLTAWMLQMFSDGHSASDLFSAETDGIPNWLTFAGALVVLVGGLLGTRAGTAVPWLGGRSQSADGSR